MELYQLTNFQDLHDYFSKKSMMEIMGVDRDENAHSNFLAWLFENEETSKYACKLLIKLLQRRAAEEEKVKALPNNLANVNIDKICKVKVTREAFVQATYEKKSNKIEDAQNNCSGTEVKGRTDIVIDLLDGKNNISLKIIIENKVDSEEICKWCYKKEKPDNQISKEDRNDKRTVDNNLWQTKFYYDYYSRQHGENKVVYAFLTLPNSDGPKCKKFIHITYQNIMNDILIPIKDIASESTLSQIKDYIKALGINYSQDEVMAVSPELKTLANQLLKTNDVIKKLYNLRQQKDSVNDKKERDRLIEFWNCYTTTGVAYRDILRPFFEVLSIIKNDKDNKDGRDDTEYRNGDEVIRGKNPLFRWIVEKYIVSRHPVTPSVEELQLMFPPSLHGKTVSAREGSCTDKNIIIGEPKSDFSNIYKDNSFGFWNKYCLDNPCNKMADIYVCQTGWDGPAMMSRLIKYVKENIPSFADLNIREVPSFLKESKINARLTIL